MNRPTNVLIVGVGGQGVIMISKVLARLCQLEGMAVKQSEVHGMAKRGGSVFSHVRFGDQVWSPTIPAGEADVLVSLEWAEGLRWLHYLDPAHGTFITDTKAIVPPFACRDRRFGAELGYARSTVMDVAERVPNSFALDASSEARRMGNERVANSILLGVLSKALDFPADRWRETLVEFVPPKTLEINRQAFDFGRDWSEQSLDDSSASTADRPAGDTALSVFRAPTVTLEITGAWCKGCDICVKMCPERCLGLNGLQIAELIDPDACTGCRICEWLCPDFAITVKKQAAVETLA